MIYIHEVNFENQIYILSNLSKENECDFIAWMYPHTKLKSIIGLALKNDDGLEGESVTHYENDCLVKRTSRIPFIEIITSKLLNSSRKIRNNCDSLALYDKDVDSWFACCIGHEGIILVRDERYLSVLIEQGVDATVNPPEWWW